MAHNSQYNNKYVKSQEATIYISCINNVVIPNPTIPIQMDVEARTKAADIWWPGGEGGVVVPEEEEESLAVGEVLDPEEDADWPEDEKSSKPSSKSMLPLRDHDDDGADGQKVMSKSAWMHWKVLASSSN
jgi:hypothetical protein